MTLTAVKIPSVTSIRANGEETTCPAWFNHGVCDNGHEFARLDYCGREWCPICGAKDSDTHKRRFARWLPKAQTFHVMGYLILTIPEHIREEYRSKKALNILCKSMTNGDKSKNIIGILKEMGFDIGLSRWHWFGDKSNKWNPHLNILLEHARLTHSQLRQIKAAWAGLLGTDVVDVHYEYSYKIPKMVFWLKYVTRATFKDYQWEPLMATRLYNFRNNKTWGDFNRPQIWHLKDGDQGYEEIAKLENHECPLCATTIRWSSAISSLWLKAREEHLKDINAGYYYIDSS